MAYIYRDIGRLVMFMRRLKENGIALVLFFSVFCRRTWPSCQRSRRQGRQTEERNAYTPGDQHAGKKKVLGISQTWRIEFIGQRTPTFSPGYSCLTGFTHAKTSGRGFRFLVFLCILSHGFYLILLPLYDHISRFNFPRSSTLPVRSSTLPDPRRALNLNAILPYTKWAYL